MRHELRRYRLTQEQLHSQLQTLQQPGFSHLLLGGGKGYLPIQASLQGLQEKVPINTKCSGSRLCG